MIATFVSPWLLAGLLVFSITVTLLADWVAAGLGRPALPERLSAAGIVCAAGNLVWMALLFLAGVIAARYGQRMAAPVVGYVVFGIVACLLSLLWAHLQRQVTDEQATWLLRGVVHNLIYLFFALVSYLVLALLADRPADPILFIPLCVGALLPDLDSGSTLLGRLLPFVSRRLQARLGHRQAWHTLAANAFVALVTAPLIAFIGWPAWALISLGFLAHLIIDLLSPEGLMLLWPVTRTRYCVLGFLTPGSTAQRLGLVLLAASALFLLLRVDLGPAAPPPAAALSYEQTLERYYSMRGRNLVIARVEGSWQATGRRMSGSFEVLNAQGQSFVLLDRYDGAVFTAGREATDNFYPSSISLSLGSAVRIKPVEVHLREQRMFDALPTIYQMQGEPGLEHIYVSGDVVLPASQEVTSPTLQVDYAQNQIRKIQAHEPGHYSLHYLTASELIDLAHLQVDLADLILVATYATPVAGPTVTPLPSPPPPPTGTP
jgi:inner membrane protein